MVLFTAFAIGISFSATFVTLFYLTRAHDLAGSPKDVNLAMITILSRFAYGFANVLNVILGNTIQSAGFTGALLGILLSFAGRFGLNLPIKLFRFKKEDEWKVHVIAPFLYALIFIFVVRTLNSRILKI